MLDIKFIRENADLIKDGARKKHIEFNVDRLVEVDVVRRELITAVEVKKAEQNKVSDQITSTADQTERTKLIEEMRTLKESIKGMRKSWLRL